MMKYVHAICLASAPCVLVFTESNFTWTIGTRLLAGGGVGWGMSDADMSHHSCGHEDIFDFTWSKCRHCHSLMLFETS